MSDFRRIFAAMNNYEQFVCTMSTMSLKFTLLPEWVQNVAYSSYETTYQELMDMMANDKHITPDEVIGTMWADSVRSRYMKDAEYAHQLGQHIQDHIGYLKDFDGVMEFFKSQGLFAHQMVEENSVFFSIDVAGETPVILTKFSEKNQLTYMDVYKNPVDLETGDIRTFEQLSKIQTEQKKAEREQSEKNYQRPTGKQLTMARALCEQQGIEMPYFTTRKACSRFIYKLVHYPKEEAQNPPRIADQLKAAAQAKANQEKLDKERAGSEQCMQI